MNLLALDLGTKCGYAHRKDSGVWDLQPSQSESAGERYRKFKERSTICIRSWEIDYVVYEEVRNHRAVRAAHVYGGLEAILQTICIEHNIEYKGVPVGTIKKHAAGNGNAKKPEMIKAAIKLFPSTNVIDDNHADALCLFDYALTNILF